MMLIECCLQVYNAMRFLTFIGQGRMQRVALSGSERSAPLGKGAEHFLKF